MSDSFATPGTVAHEASLFIGLSRQEYWSGYSILQGIFLTQGSNLSLRHCRKILYHLSHQGSPFFRLGPDKISLVRVLVC